MGAFYEYAADIERMEAGEDSTPDGAMQAAAHLRAEGMHARAFDWSKGSAGLMLDPQPGDDEYAADITRMEQGT